MKILKSAFLRSIAMGLALSAPLVAQGAPTDTPSNQVTPDAAPTAPATPPAEKEKNLKLMIDGKRYPCPELDAATKHDPELRQKYLNKDPNAFTTVETLKDLCFARFKEEHPDPLANNPFNTKKMPFKPFNSPPWFRI